MSEILSEVEFRDRLANLEEQAVIAAMEPVEEEAARTQQREILAHDAALRAQVTQLTEERDAAVQLYGGALSAIRIAVKLESSQVNDIVKAVYRLQRESAAREAVLVGIITQMRELGFNVTGHVYAGASPILLEELAGNFDLYVSTFYPVNLTPAAQALLAKADSADRLADAVDLMDGTSPIGYRPLLEALAAYRLAAAQQAKETGE